MANIVHVGDKLLIFRVRVKDDGAVRDISSATTKEIKLRDESGNWTTFTATFTTNGTDGFIEYATTTTSIVDTEGDWQIQAYCVLSDGTEFHTKVGFFTVLFAAPA